MPETLTQFNAWVQLGVCGRECIKVRAGMGRSGQAETAAKAHGAWHAETAAKALGGIETAAKAQGGIRETAAKAQRPLGRQLQKPALRALDETAAKARWGLGVLGCWREWLGPLGALGPWASGGGRVPTATPKSGAGGSCPPPPPKARAQGSQPPRQHPRPCPSGFLADVSSPLELAFSRCLPGLWAFSGCLSPPWAFSRCLYAPKRF